MTQSSPSFSPPAAGEPCPCCSGKTYDACCGPILAGERVAADAEQLMRARYTAHAIHDFGYVHRTYLPTSETPFTNEDYENSIKWTKLEIHSHEPEVKPGISHVEFSAHFTENGKSGVHHEKSEFLHIDGAWIFTRPLREGPAPVVTAVKVGRNDPCPCGSGKKYKKCCGA